MVNDTACDDGVALDAIAAQLNGKTPFPESVFFGQVRELIRDTGRTCADPPAGPELSEETPSGY